MKINHHCLRFHPDGWYIFGLRAPLSDSGGRSEAGGCALMSDLLFAVTLLPTESCLERLLLLLLTSQPAFRRSRSLLQLSSG